MALSRLWRTREHLSVQCQVNFVLNLYGQVLFGPGREPFFTCTGIGRHLPCDQAA